MRSVICAMLAGLAFAGVAGDLDLNSSASWNADSWAKLSVLGEERMTDFVDEGACITLGCLREPKPREACNISTRDWLPLEPNAKYRISCWADVDSEGAILFGVNSWNNKYKRHYYRLRSFGAVPGWHYYEWTLETSSAEEYPVFETKLTRGTIGFVPDRGVRRLRLRDWKLERIK